MHRLAPISILLLAPAVAAAGQGARPPTFSASDQLTAAKALCGDVSRGTVKDTIGGTPEVVKGFVAADKRSICIELLSRTARRRRDRTARMLSWQNPPRRGARQARRESMQIRHEGRLAQDCPSRTFRCM
jgi:hypothetical protein